MKGKEAATLCVYWRATGAGGRPVDENQEALTIPPDVPWRGPLTRTFTGPQRATTTYTAVLDPRGARNLGMLTNSGYGGGPEDSGRPVIRRSGTARSRVSLGGRTAVSSTTERWRMGLSSAVVSGAHRIGQQAPTSPSRAARLRGASDRSAIVIADVAAIFAALLLTGGLDKATITYLLALPIWLAFLGSYRSRIAPTIQTDLLPLLGSLACPTFVLALLGTPSALRLVEATPTLALFVVMGRLASYKLQGAVRARPGAGDRTVIVGAGILGCNVARALLDHPEYGLTPVGFVDGFPDDGTLPIPIIGNIDTFDEVVRQVAAKHVIVAFGANRESEIVSVLRASAAAHVEVHIVPRLFELGVTPSGPEADFVWGFPLQHARRAALRTPSWRTKRVVDSGISAFALLVLAPLMLGVALLVKLTSPGPILFRQLRVGQRGQVVKIYKFRSMIINGESDTRWGKRDDDRATSIGRLIRATSIDELPQIFNVLRGDMSLVGPRPERPHFADKFDQSVLRYNDRLRVPVGLTGWAQVHGLRGDTSIEERARFDNYYIEHWSLWFDVVILARTVTQVLRELRKSVSNR